MTFFFKAPLEVSLARILDNRPVLKFHEAGLDLKLSADPYESFRLFQGRIFEQYLALSTEFNFHLIDAVQRIELQQGLVRQLVAHHVDLPGFVSKRAA
jgi:dTMP kinase